MLCEACQQWAAAVSRAISSSSGKAPPPWPSLEHVLHRDVDALKRASEARCYVCRNALNALADDIRGLEAAAAAVEAPSAAGPKVALRLRPDGQVFVLLQTPDGSGQYATSCTRMLAMYAGEVGSGEFLTSRGMEERR